MSAVNFVFNLIDKMSGPGEKISKALTGVAKQTRESDKTIKELDKQLAKLARVSKLEEMQKATDPIKKHRAALELQKMTLAAGAQEATDAAEKHKGLARGINLATGAAGLAGSALAALASAALVAGAAGAGLAAVGASYALDMLKFKQNTEFAWKYTQGSQEKAAGTMALAAQLAGELGSSTKDVAAQMNEIFKSGAKGGEARGMIKVLADMKALGVQQDPKALGDAMMAMAKGGALNIATLGPLIEKGDGAKTKVYESLAAKLKIKGANADDTARRVDEALAGGALKGQKGLQAYQDAIKSVTGKGAVGDLGKAFNNETIDGSIDKIKGKVDELFTKLNTGGVGTMLVGALQKISAALDPATPSGEKLLATLNKMAGVAGKLFARIDFDKMIAGFGMIVGAVDAVMGPVLKVGNAFADGLGNSMGTVMQLVEFLDDGKSSGSGFADALAGVAQAVGFVLGGVVLLVGGLGFLAVRFVNLIADMGSAGMNIGKAMIDGIGSGIDSAKATLLEKLNALAALLPDSVRKLLGIHSPSKVFAEIGKNTMQGFTQGVDDEADTVRERTVSALSPKMTAVGAAVSGGAGGRGNTSITVNVDATGASDPAAVRQAAEEGATAGTMRVFELLGLETGAVGPAT